MKIKRKRYRYRFRSRTSENKRIKYITILLAVSLIVISCIFLILGLKFNNSVKPDYSYLINKSSPYEVLLLPNEFYAENILSPNRYYASKSIDSLYIDFKYHFKGSKQTNIEYVYGITADLVGTVDNSDGQKKEVWTRNYILQENVTSSSVNTDGFLVDKDINIDYKSYNNLVRSYEKTYGIVIEASLKIRLNISYLVDLSNLNLPQEKIEDNIELNIPITNNVTKVNEDYQSETTKNIISDKAKLDIREIIFYVLSGLFLLVAISIFIIRIIIKNKSTPEEMYNHNIKRILKYYKDLIVTVSNEPNLTNLEVMNINVLGDLIDVAEQNQCNIIHYEIVKKERSNLYVIVGNYVYIYIVTSDIIR